MARYRSKDETDLTWNRIRRTVTREIDTQIGHQRDKILNYALTKAWEDFSAALDEGRVIEVEAQYASLVTPIIDSHIPESLAEKVLDGAPVD